MTPSLLQECPPGTANTYPPELAAHSERDLIVRKSAIVPSPHSEALWLLTFRFICFLEPQGESLTTLQYNRYLEFLNKIVQGYVSLLSTGDIVTYCPLCLIPLNFVKGGQRSSHPGWDWAGEPGWGWQGCPPSRGRKKEQVENVQLMLPKEAGGWIILGHGFPKSDVLYSTLMESFHFRR